MGYVRSDGCDLYYEQAGNGVPILLIPPAGTTATTWGPVTDELARIGRVITYDRRGYARSVSEPVRSVSRHTFDAAAILQHLHAAPAIVVGTSAGATIAVDLAVRRPDLVQAVIAHEAAWRASRRLPNRSQLAANTATQPTRSCAPPTPIVTVEPRGTRSPRNGAESPGRTAAQP
jgi:pimeloyl-ACP methyl ester carboxylesterase